MMATVLALEVLLTTNGGCYVVTNTRIAKLPTCDFGSATIELLTEKPSPVPPSGVPSRRRYVPGNQSPGWAGSAVRGNDELEHRLALSEQERLSAVEGRVAAEQQRDEAWRQRDQARKELERVRKERAALLCHGVPGRPTDEATPNLPRRSSRGSRAPSGPRSSRGRS